MKGSTEQPQYPHRACTARAPRLILPRRVAKKASTSSRFLTTCLGGRKGNMSLTAAQSCGAVTRKMLRPTPLSLKTRGGGGGGLGGVAYKDRAPPPRAGQRGGGIPSPPYPPPRGKAVLPIPWGTVLPPHTHRHTHTHTHVVGHRTCSRKQNNKAQKMLVRRGCQGEHNDK